MDAKQDCLDRIKIGSRAIGRDAPCFIIAEAGVNHNGKIALARKLVDAAVSAKADAVKFQIFDSKELATAGAEVADYMRKNTGSNGKQLGLLQGLELKRREFIELKQYCKKKGIIFLCTPHSGIKDVEFLESIGIDAYKIGSGDLTNAPLLAVIAKKGRPMLLSTGMGNMRECIEAVETIRGNGNMQIVAMQCTTNYPAQVNEVNLRAMQEMERELHTLVGFSDHTMSTLIPAIAAALGACVVEKHLTISRKMKGPDHAASLEPKEFREMVENIRNAELALGSREKKPSASEIKMMETMRKSIVAAKDIPKGSIITEESICMKRPGTGLSPMETAKVLGKRARHGIKKDEMIMQGDVE